MTDLAECIFYIQGNHSCDPNAEVFFPDNNHNLAVKALKDINEGEVSFLLSSVC